MNFRIIHFSITRRTPLIPLSSGRGQQRRHPAERELEDRGAKFWEYSNRPRGNQMLNYEGIGFQKRGAETLLRSNSTMDNDTTYDGDSDSAQPAGASKVHVKGTVVVNFKSFYEYQSSRKIMLATWSATTA